MQLTKNVRSLKLEREYSTLSLKGLCEMLLDCHLHTRNYSSCSTLDPSEACTLAARRGLHGLVFTEHHRLWDVRDLAILQRGHPGLILHRGMEISVAEGYDLVVISPGVTREFPPGTPFAKVEKALAGVRGESFVFLAHPFRYTERCDAAINMLLEYADAVEHASINILRAGCERMGDHFRSLRAALYENASRRHGLPGIYNSDSHFPQAVGAVASEIDVCEISRDPGEFVAQLKAASFREHQNTALLSALFG
ncbi:histidinol phosphatase [Desulfolutivibrio sulfoxidireducens]|nr:histidinol phosphatase [Desulfolutivibrio sulfoxidireducens]